MADTKAVTTTPVDSFMHLLHAAWTTCWTTRRWMVGLLISVLVTVLPGLLITSLVKLACEGPTETSCPSPPVGPGGQVVEDRFYFAHQSLTGSGSMTVRVTSLTGIITYPPPNHDTIVPGVVPWAKAGVMIKENTEPGSAYAAMMVTGSHGVRMQHTFTEDIAGTPGSVSAESPRWLRLTRAGDTLTGYESTDGIQWTEIGTASLVGLPATVQVGLFVTSPCDLTVAQRACRFTQATGVFDQVSLDGAVSGTWSRTEVGDDPLMTDWERYHRANGLVTSGGTFTMTGTGDIAPRVDDGGWPIERTLIGTVAGALGMIIVGVLFSSTPALLVGRKRRARELAAKAIVIGAVSFVIILVAASVAVLLGNQMLRAKHIDVLPLSPVTELRIIVGTAALLAIIAVFALALGTVFQRRAPAIGIALAVIVLPYILAISSVLPVAAAQWLLRLTPAAAFAIQQSLPVYPQVTGLYIPAAGYYPLSPWAGFAVLCGYTALTLGLAVAQLRRHDTRTRNDPRRERTGVL